MTAEAAPVAYVPMSPTMAHMLTSAWSQPVQIRLVAGDRGPELVFRSVSWKRLDPQPEAVQ